MLKVASLFQLVGFVWITWFLLGLSNVRTYENKIMVEHFLKQIMFVEEDFIQGTEIEYSWVEPVQFIVECCE